MSFPPSISSDKSGSALNHQEPARALGVCLCVKWTLRGRMTHSVFSQLLSQSPTLILWHELSSTALRQLHSGTFVGFTSGRAIISFNSIYITWPLKNDSQYFPLEIITQHTHILEPSSFRSGNNSSSSYTLSKPGEEKYSSTSQSY